MLCSLPSLILSPSASALIDDAAESIEMLVDVATQPLHALPSHQPIAWEDEDEDEDEDDEDFLDDDEDLDLGDEEDEDFFDDEDEDLDEDEEELLDDDE